MLETGELASRGNALRNPRDSLDPKGIWSEFGGKDVMKYLAFVDQHREEDDVPYQQVVAKEQLPPLEQSAMSKNDNIEIQHVASPTPPFSSPTATNTTPAVDMAKATCTPRSSITRSHRPFQLELDDSRGATSLSTTDLRDIIKSTPQSETFSVSTRAQVIQHDTLLSPVTRTGRKKYSNAQPQLYGTSLTVHLPQQQQQQQQQQPQYQSQSAGLPMGNQHSHLAPSHALSQAAISARSSSDENGSSVDSVLDYTHHRSHKSGHKRASIGMLKKKPLANSSSKGSAAVTEVPRAATAPNLDAIEDVDIGEDNGPLQKNDLTRRRKVLSAASPTPLPTPGSPDTITEESAARPLSAGTTITAHSTRHDGREDDDSSLGDVRVSALSPTIPTPSPVPQDSPHQYGLKDFTDSPSPQPSVDAKKAKRRSNGAEIFKDARDLQTAASFLNGLSDARRRAEYRADSRNKARTLNQSTTNFSLASASTDNLVSRSNAINFSNPAAKSMTHLPTTGPPSPTLSTPPLTPKLDNVSRTLGHTHKSSGFAYAKALSPIQLKCYRNHDRLMRSGNQHYQVECAICHCDDAGDYYWSCSWCAVRMCSGCRAVFRQQGIKALKEKIRSAEFAAVAAAAT